MELKPGLLAKTSTYKKYVNEKLPKHRMPKSDPNPFVMGYVSELDDIRLFDATCTDYYHYLSDALQWCTEIWRIDLCTEVSLLSVHHVAPHERHLDAALHIMAHLKQRYNTCLIFDLRSHLPQDSC